MIIFDSQSPFDLIAEANLNLYFGQDLIHSIYFGSGRLRASDSQPLIREF